MDVYVGPLVRCRIERVVTTATRRGCVQDGCRKFHNAPVPDADIFCSACGSQYGKYKEPCDGGEKVDHWSLFGGRDPLISYQSRGQWRVFIPNHSRSPLRDFYVDLDEGHDEELREGQIAADLAWFEQAFSSEIVELRATYGSDNARVEWCVVAVGE